MSRVKRRGFNWAPLGQADFPEAMNMGITAENVAEVWNI